MEQIVEINNYHIGGEISDDVYRSVEKVVNYIGQDSLLKCEIDDIYPMDYGTLIIEWMKNGRDILSLEIGKSQLGYFIEIDGNYIRMVDGGSIEELLP